jgi:spermidine/putrescine transport system permease protein
VTTSPLQRPGGALRSRLTRVQERTDGVRVDSRVLAFPAALAFVVFFAVPLGMLLVFSFLTPDFFSVHLPFTLEAYRDALSNESNRELAVNSLIVGGVVGVVCALLALPIAFWVRYIAGRAQLPILFLIVATLFTSYLVRIYAWRTMLGDRGVLNSALQSSGLIEEPLEFLLFSRVAVIIAEAHILLPFMVLMLYAALRPVTPEYLEAAQDLGANAWTRWRRVILPAVAAPLTTSFLFVFVLAASDFVTPQFLGGPTGSMIGVKVANEVRTNGNWPTGASVAMLILAVVVLCYLLAMSLLRRANLTRLKWG